MTDDRSRAKRMMALFDGFSGAHGTHGATKRNLAKRGKLEIKTSARTLRESPSLELWEQHLRGDYPLGIIPVRDDDTCIWGCIDVDDQAYHTDLGEMVRDLRMRKSPLVLCRSKSGGAHLFLFLKSPEPAEEVAILLRQHAASLGFGSCEIYPKQSKILKERGDLGNWLNMPYLGGDATERYCVREKTGAAMGIDAFIDHAERSKIDLSALEEVATGEPQQDETLSDGPPCLQHLATVGFPEGSRNNGLFGLATFCRKKFGGRWREMLEQYNRDYMKPPLSSEEVMEVAKSAERREYNYRCRDEPLISYCNSALCMTRKFGVGGAGQYPMITGMSMLNTDPPLWFADVDGQRIELTVDDLFDYKSIQRKCAKPPLHNYYLTLKRETFEQLMQAAFSKCQPADPEPELGTEGHFMELLEEFLTNRGLAHDPDEIFNGNPWLDEDAGRYYFRLRDLMAHLESERFKAWGRNKVSQRIKDLSNGDGKKFMNIRGKGVNLLWVPSDLFKEDPKVPLPETPHEPI